MAKTKAELDEEIRRELAQGRREIIGKSLVSRGGGTADGKDLYLFGDGAITVGRWGAVIKGTAGRTLESVDVARRVGWYVLDDSILYDAGEIERLVYVARPILSRGGTPGEVRAAFAGSQKKAGALKPVWTVLEADRDGKPRLRAWRLPRILGLGSFAVWDDARKAHRGRYEIMHEMGRSGTYAPTGERFGDLDGVNAWIAEHRRLNAK